MMIDLTEMDTEKMRSRIEELSYQVRELSDDLDKVKPLLDEVDSWVDDATNISDFLDYLVIESSTLSSSVARTLLDSRSFEKLRELLLEAK